MEILPEGVNATIKKGPGLYEFLVEAELQHYFNSFKNTLKITHPSQLKFTTDNDLLDIGMSRPEIRRLRKFYEKHFPHNYLSKFKKLLTYRKQEHSSADCNLLTNIDSVQVTRTPRVSSKHIIPAASITINKELGMGEFGVVQQGVWCNEGERIQVAIKCLSRDRMHSNMVEFLKEASIMHNIDHQNIVRFFGVVLPNIDGSLMLVTELAPLRSLLECLKEPTLRTSFPILNLCDFAYQICDGMQYLESNRLIHRDLAARNILVFSKNKVKISDFGLSRALGQGKDYYQTNFNVNLKLPIAWCAPECISYLRFTTASDVWAFGVTLWEMFSYGFQPWAALTGQQILEAIDEPNFQRLEQPDCCPLEHYNLMLDCWRHEAATRPRFNDIIPILVESRPEQVQAKLSSNDGQHMLTYRVGDVITVLDKKTHHPLWKGVTSTGKTGLFDPMNVVAYLGSDLPSSSNTTFTRNDSTRSSARRKLRSEMISAPQGDFKHTGHVGLDGAYFGDLSFLGGSKGNYGSTVPTQVVAPYRPHKDLEAAPLLLDGGINNDHNIQMNQITTTTTLLQDHEYHEISDEETNGGNDSPPAHLLDLGPSLMAEMEMMFNTLGGQEHHQHHHHQQQQQQHNETNQQDLCHEGTMNRTNELKEKLTINNTKSRKQATVKPISANDRKTLDTAIALANEITIRSVSAPVPTTPISPTKKKFSFRFPSTSSSVNHHHHHQHHHNNNNNHHNNQDQHNNHNQDNKNIEKRNFSEEALSKLDLQSKVTQEAQMAYQGLIETPTSDVTQLMVTNPLRILRLGQVPVITPRSRSVSVTSTLPPRMNDCVRNSVPENLNATKPDFSMDDSSTLHTSSFNKQTRPDNENNSNNLLIKDDNPIPLPPRDRNKSLLTAKPRHTRKHPLIIPPSSLQRTLDKVNTITIPSSPDQLSPPSLPTVLTTIQTAPPIYINEKSNNNNNIMTQIVEVKNCESMTFEQEIESNLNALDDITVCSMNENVDVVDGTSSSSNSGGGSTGTSGGDDNNKLYHSHHVSCEDLLKFANTKPDSRTRGSESDEVRIMLKYLGKDVTDEKCLEALDQSEWNCMRAIKIVQLQNMVKTDMKQCMNALDFASWDVAKAAQWILQQDGEVTQV